MEIENGKYYSLGVKALALSIVQRGGLIIILMAIVLLLINFASPLLATFGDTASSVLSLVSGVVVMLTIAAEIIIILAAILEYSVSKIMLDDGSLKIVRGVLSKEQISLPYRRIQSVEIKQTLLGRIIGVGRLAISTTTDIEQPGEHDSEEDDQIIPLLDYSLASLISNAISERAETEKMQIQQRA